MITKNDVEILRQILPKIDYTPALNPYNTREDVIKACEEAKQYGFNSVVVYPHWTSLAAELLKGSDVQVQAPIGFPHGAHTTATKVFETRNALENGATEIDMVVNYARVLDGDYDYVRDEIAQVVACAAEFGVKVKAIMEVGYLNDEQKRKLAEVAVEAGCEYVKTCTGFGPGKATVHDVCLLKETVGDRAKVKATGGVASLEDQWTYIQLGAERVAGRENILAQLKEIGVEGRV